MQSPAALGTSLTPWSLARTPDLWTLSRRLALAAGIDVLPIALIVVASTLMHDGPELSAGHLVPAPTLVLFFPQLLSVAVVYGTVGFPTGGIAVLVFWLACLRASLLYV